MAMNASVAPAAWKEEVLSLATDRFERRLTEEMATLRLDLRQALHDGLTSVRQELSTTRVELIRWSFLFWVGQVAAMTALMALMLRGR
ncbi:MAG TPA: hypothetical protein VGJ29_18040 [Vicinamibacterales bacterium]|jgi:hypothetical protein